MANYYAVQMPSFKPAMTNILSITNANPAVITTTFDGINPGVNTYQSGLIGRVYIPFGYGMSQLNLVEASITVINSTSFYFNVNTTTMDPFVLPTYSYETPTLYGTPAQFVPIGEINSQMNQAVKNVLPYV